MFLKNPALTSLVVVYFAVGCSANKPTREHSAKPADGRPVVAVFEIQPKGLELSDEEVDILSSYLSAAIASGSTFRVAPPDDLRVHLRRHKVHATDFWYDRSTQYENRLTAMPDAYTVMGIWLEEEMREGAFLYAIR